MHKQKETITRIAIWDFDGTFFSTPFGKEALLRYKEVTGTDWPHKGWWGRAESLDDSIFMIPVIESVLADYQSEATKEGVLLVLLTGRLYKLRKSVEKLLDIYNIKFDERHYNPGGSTLDFKIATMADLLVRYPNATSMHLWEDRDLHIIEFDKYLKGLVETGKLSDYHITHIKSNQYE